MTNFGAYKCYTLSKSGCTHSIKNYFEIYKEYKPLDKGGDIEVNSIGGIINPNGVDTVALGMEYYTGKIQNIFFLTSTTSPGRPISSSDLKNGSGTKGKLKPEVKGPTSR